MSKLLQLLENYEILILTTGLILSLIGLFLNIYANSILYNIIHSEKKLEQQKIEGMVTNTKSNEDIINHEVMLDRLEVNLQKLFDKKLEASKYSYVGVIIMAIGFIMSNVFNIILIVNRKK